MENNLLMIRFDECKNQYRKDNKAGGLDRIFHLYKFIFKGRTGFYQLSAGLSALFCDYSSGSIVPVFYSTGFVFKLFLK